MELEIKPIKNDAYDCIQGLIVAIAKYKNRNYKMMFLSRWGFDYFPDEDNSKLIGERISCGWYGYWSALGKYHGTRINWDKNTNNNLSVNTIREKLLEGDPIILKLNTFWCPWNYAFKKYYMNHFCLAIGINEESNKIICIDPYMSDKVESLKAKELIHVEKYGTLKFGQDNPTQWKLKEVLNEVINLINENSRDRNMFESMLLFANEIESKDRLEKELISFNDIYMIPITSKIKIISSSRKAFAETLEYISQEKKCDRLEKVCKKIRKASSAWDKIRLLLIKMAMTNIKENDIKKVSQDIRNLAAYERDIYEDIGNLISEL